MDLKRSLNRARTRNRTLRVGYPGSEEGGGWGMCLCPWLVHRNDERGAETRKMSDAGTEDAQAKLRGNEGGSMKVWRWLERVNSFCRQLKLAIRLVL
eukprot:755561-Hanusia_phi.AAC.1